MDAFDYADVKETPTRRRKAPSSMVINILTILVLVMTVCMMGVFGMIFLNPNVGFNPFPPPTLPALVILPTITPTPRALPPTWTPTITPLPTDTPTPRPSSTPFPTPTEFGAPTSTPDATLEASFSFTVQQGNPVAISSAAFHPDYGCSWMGVAGQALDMSGAPVPFLIVQLGGTLPGKSFDLTTVTGSAQQYGGGSFFEFTLADKPVASRGSVWMQLQDIAGIALSDKVYIDTYADCDRNLIIVNFKQVR